jgi:hypothetical protein
MGLAIQEKPYCDKEGTTCRESLRSSKAKVFDFTQSQV